MGSIAREKLELLIRIISELASVEDQHDLIKLIVGKALEFSGAERGFLILNQSTESMTYYDNQGSEIPCPEISLSTIKQVFNSGSPVNLIENSEGESIPPTASILALNLKTIMCAPLIHYDDSTPPVPFAILYVDSRIVSRPFTRQDLDFFSLLAGHASVVWHNLEMNCKMQSDFKLLHEEVRSKYDYHKIVGKCESMRQVYKTLEILKETNLDVLIIGETGTGKELIAKAIHYGSRRSEMPLKQLNCAALPEGLVEAELFGVEKNVATEVNRRTGKLEQAQNGTLFLDEIGDMPVRVQNRLLRFLETRSFRRIGGREELRADVRVLAATNKNLEQEIEAGRFRDALRFRLDVVTIKLPALRERGDDLELLADFFLSQAIENKNNKIQGFTSDAWKAMREYSWPGNVRELKHRVQSAAFLAKSSLIGTHDLGLRKAPELSQIQPLATQLMNLEINIIKSALTHCGNKYDQAAALIGIKEEELKRKIKKLKIA